MARRKFSSREQVLWWGAAAVLVVAALWLAVRQGVIDPLRLRGDVGGGVNKENPQCAPAKSDDFKTDYARGEASAPKRKDALDAATANALRAAAASCGDFVKRPEPWDELRCGPACVPKGELSCKAARLDRPGTPYKGSDCRNREAVFDREKKVWHGSAECRLDCECQQACEKRYVAAYVPGPIGGGPDYYDDGDRQCRSAKAVFRSVNFVGQGFGVATDNEKAKAIARDEALKDAAKLAQDKAAVLIEKEEFLKCEEGCVTDGPLSCTADVENLEKQCTISYTNFGNGVWGARAECSTNIMCAKQCKPKAGATPANISAPGIP